MIEFNKAKLHSRIGRAIAIHSKANGLLIAAHISETTCAVDVLPIAARGRPAHGRETEQRSSRHRPSP